MQKVEADKVVREMISYLNNQQLVKLKSVLGIFVSADDVEDSLEDNELLLEKYFAAKRTEGCSEKSIKYYKATLIKALTSIGKNAREIVTDELRDYLTNYQIIHE